LLPVTVDEGADQQASTIAADPIAGGTLSLGSIEVTLARGRIRIAGAVDTGTLRAVLGCLLS
jgi:hypothetical protein